MKPCPECWVEAQRRTIVAGTPTDEAYRETLLFCPMLHDVTTLPPDAGAPW